MTLQNCSALQTGETLARFVQRLRPGVEMYELRRTAIPSANKPYGELPLGSPGDFAKLNAQLSHDLRLFERVVS